MKLEELGRVDIKRLYIPVVLKDECPKCGGITEFDGSSEYLSYPEGPEEIRAYCSNCDDWVKSKYKIEIVAKVTYDGKPVQ